MARSIKKGLDYFPLDVQMEDKVKLVQAKYGMEGYGLLIKLWQKIYSQGYYINWEEEIQLLFSSEVNVDINRVNDIINDCLNRGIFNKDLYEEYSVLTSHGIQIRYKEATYRRKKVKMKEEYVLLSEDEINGNMVNENNNPLNDVINSKNDDNNKQSKVKESKVKKSTSSSKNNSEYNDRKEANQAEKPKDEEEESKTDENYSQIPDAFHKAFNQVITPYQYETLESYLEDGISEKAVVMALKQAARANANSLNYVKKILDTWLEKDIKTEKQAEQAIEEFKSRKKERGNSPPRQSYEELMAQGYQ